jgi:SAM-dependent methyltransferase
VTVRYDTGEVEELDAAAFFRPPEDMDVLDLRALDGAKGRVLDVGAGAGAHALALEARGLAVTALELVPEAARVLRSRGLADVVEADLWRFSPRRRYDTVLALMNGAGLAGTLGRLASLIQRLGSFLAPGGALLMDSADLTEDAGPDTGDGRYPGDLQIQLAYRGAKGPPFPHVFVDPTRLEAAARAAGWQAVILARDGEGRYLARLTLAESATPRGRRG